MADKERMCAHVPAHGEQEGEGNRKGTGTGTDDGARVRAARTTVATRAAALGIVSPVEFERLHRRHALRAELCGWVCLPDFVYEDLLGRLRGSLGDERARQAVRQWAVGVRASWEASGQIPGDDAPAFWRNEWQRTHGSNRPASSSAYADPLKGVKDLLAKGGNLAEG